MMNIWIDFSNSPHVILFEPIIKEFKRQGHNVDITIRNFAQTVSLANDFNIDGQLIGEHGGKSMVSLIINFIKRSWALYNYAKDKKYDIALSHNSYAQILAAKLLKIKVVTMMDFEGQPANHLAFRLADKVIVPDVFPDQALKKFGVKQNKISKYSGFKEQIYLSSFKPSDNFLYSLIKDTNISKDIDFKKKVIVSIRPPATMALYHRFENDLFDDLLMSINRNNNIVCFVFPRNKEQAEFIQMNFSNFIIPSKSVDGKNMLYYSDLVISAGGTMNREAAILGTPAYTIFAGNLPSVDKSLIQLKRMKYLHTIEDVEMIKFEKKKTNIIYKNNELIFDIIKSILS